MYLVISRICCRDFVKVSVVVVVVVLTITPKGWREKDEKKKIFRDLKQTLEANPFPLVFLLLLFPCNTAEEFQKGKDENNFITLKILFIHFLAHLNAMTLEQAPKIIIIMISFVFQTKRRQGTWQGGRRMKKKQKEVFLLLFIVAIFVLRANNNYISSSISFAGKILVYNDGTKMGQILVNG